MTHDLNESFQKLLGSFMKRHGGCVIIHDNGKFKVESQVFNSLDEAMEFIDKKSYLLDGRFVTKEVYEKAIQKN